jgi:carbamoylphosphate synthase large subunit
MDASKVIGFPCMVRCAFALGGLGSALIDDADKFEDHCREAFASSPQVLVEKSLKGWKEVEYEVVRDAADNCITVRAHSAPGARRPTPPLPSHHARPNPSLALL